MQADPLRQGCHLRPNCPVMRHAHPFPPGWRLAPHPGRRHTLPRLLHYPQHLNSDKMKGKIMTIKEKADKLLHETGLCQELKKYGEPHPIGSYRMD